LLISNASKELEARTREELILKELQKVFDKHGVSRVEKLGLVKSLAKISRPSSGSVRVQAKRTNKKRVAVRPKYRHPSSRDTWTGRGRAPKWVVALCEERKITLAAFKSSSDFSI
jgi:DNA-binding protein H-NS